MPEFDVCVVGSGAGGAPVAATLAGAGRSVVVLEKGPWLRAGDFFKDDRAMIARRACKPMLRDEPHVLEDRAPDGDWQALPTYQSERDFWNGSCVGGATNFMSGMFQRLKPDDFRLRSAYGPIADATIVDWPIGYEDLEPYYTRVESEIGVSGRVVRHPQAEPRSRPDYLFPPTREHPLAARIDSACTAAGLHPLPLARAILPHAHRGRGGCEYSGYCGGYGCATDAKGSARAALLERAAAGGNCRIRANAHVVGLKSDARGRVVAARYREPDGIEREVTARVFVVACQPLETCRLLLLSRGPRHPDGLGNAHGLVGQNLIFSSVALGAGDFSAADATPAEFAALRVQGPFVNRALQDWYVIDDAEFGGRVKGGTIELVMEQPNALARANTLKWGRDGALLWGAALKERLHRQFTSVRTLGFEVFSDWLPNADCRVGLDPAVTDRWGVPVARARLGYHPHNGRVARFLAARGEEVLHALGAREVRSRVYDGPPPNLVAGGCRFGHSATDSVLDRDCRVHDVDNLYVTDGSFMPTGGSVPYTWTIYANAFRVAERIVAAI